MKLGLNLGYAGTRLADITPLVNEADRLHLDSVWVAESYGSDAVAVLGYLAAITRRVALGSAILQIPARTPAATAMAAMTIDALSGGRCHLGLGVSGPQVVEGWHGVSFRDPLGRTREFVDIVRRAIRRDEPVTYDGDFYQLPLRDGAVGAGKPLRSILHPIRDQIPIHLAALGARNVELCAEIADGWMPFLHPPQRDLYAEPLRRGTAKRDPRLRPLEITTTVRLAVGNDLAACRDRIRPNLALYIGGMGPRERNFYNQAVRRLGFDEEADAIQDRYLAGDKAGAAAAVPDALVDELALVGPLERIRDRLAVFAESGVDRLLIGLDASRGVDELLPHLEPLATLTADL
ncbi:LLM class F420-dependent oxidoreductase [Pseudonocardia sp. DSM 110487]|uniref:LLM class F420-dependent oxidoreductase n=1 Tax=Pseudonocardia sp. DSM 110487 TaxID=2865833 RepID=UPI001C69DCDF|nr:LLM class F420-dependent oxidoreductase [Pseudonocardia sp. DSM 110487]QYN33911.1 LLM class F420-dependent oxidoreductase [Pseudonocardia sp. DSM 110487]